MERGQLKNSVTVKWLLKRLDNGDLVQDICQRPANQWNAQTKRHLLQTLLRENENISPIILCLSKDNKLTCLDGQQRMNTIRDFVNFGNLGLNRETILYLKSKGYKVKSQRQMYDDLPDPLKERIWNFKIPVEWLIQAEDESDADFLERKIYRFGAVNDGKIVSLSDKKQTEAIRDDAHNVFGILRSFQNLEPEGHEQSGLTGSFPTFFSVASQGADKFSWSFFFMIIWIIQEVSNGFLPLLTNKKVTLLDKEGKWNIPRTYLWLNIIRDYIKIIPEEIYTELSHDLENAGFCLQSKGTAFPKRNKPNYQDREISWENLKLCISRLLKVPKDSLPSYPEGSAIQEQAELQNRNGMADIVILSKELSEFLTEKFPPPTK